MVFKVVVSWVFVHTHRERWSVLLGVTRDGQYDDIISVLCIILRHINYVVFVRYHDIFFELFKKKWLLLTLLKAADLMLIFVLSLKL